jgi:hypothetical protein
MVFSFFPLAVMNRAYLHGVGLVEHRTRALAPSGPARIAAIAQHGCARVAATELGNVPAKRLGDREDQVCFAKETALALGVCRLDSVGTVASRLAHEWSVDLERERHTELSARQQALRRTEGVSFADEVRRPDGIGRSEQ